MSRQLFVEQPSQRSSSRRLFRFLTNFFEARFASLIAEVFQRQVTRRCVQVSFQRSTFRTVILRLANQAEEAVVRNVFSNFNRTEQPVSKTKYRVPVPIVQLQKGCLVTLSCLFKQKLVCSSLGQSSTRSCRICSCFSYLNPEKSYGPNRKNCAPLRNNWQILISQQAA